MLAAVWIIIMSHIMASDFNSTEPLKSSIIENAGHPGYRKLLSLEARLKHNVISQFYRP